MTPLVENILMRLVDLCFMLIPRRRPTRRALADCKIVAHRGEHDNRRILENTMAAFEPAAEAGCWGLEFDVRWTRDLRPVVVHDENLQRVFGIDLAVAEVDLQELRQRCPEVPTLAEVVARFGGQQHLMVELKDDHLGQFARRSECLQEIFKSLEPCRDYHFLALEVSQFEQVEFCGREACLPVAVFNLEELGQLALERGYGGICAQYLLLGNRLVRRHHQYRQKLGSGFAGSRYCFYREVNRGIDWVFTNHALRLESIRQRGLRKQ